MNLSEYFSLDAMSHYFILIIRSSPWCYPFIWVLYSLLRTILWFICYSKYHLARKFSTTLVYLSVAQFSWLSCPSRDLEKRISTQLRSLSPSTIGFAYRWNTNSLRLSEKNWSWQRYFHIIFPCKYSKIHSTRLQWYLILCGPRNIWYLD